MSDLIYLSELESHFHEASRVDIVCVGDSITGWNNIRSNEVRVQSGPFPTYPQFLQELMPELCVADCGVAGAFSKEGYDHTTICLGLFQNANYYIIGYGANDMAGVGNIPDIHERSQKIISNLEKIINKVLKKQKKPILLNVPKINGNRFPIATRLKANLERLDYNECLRDYCNQRQIPLVDIYSRLNDGHFADGIHPNEEGAGIIAQEVYRIFQLI